MPGSVVVAIRGSRRRGSRAREPRGRERIVVVLVEPEPGRQLSDPQLGRVPHDVELRRSRLVRPALDRPQPRRPRIGGAVERETLVGRAEPRSADLQPVELGLVHRARLLRRGRLEGRRQSRRAMERGEVEGRAQREPTSRDGVADRRLVSNEQGLRRGRLLLRWCRAVQRDRALGRQTLDDGSEPERPARGGPR